MGCGGRRLETGVLARAATGICTISDAQLRGAGPLPHQVRSHCWGCTGEAPLSTTTECNCGCPTDARSVAGRRRLCANTGSWVPVSHFPPDPASGTSSRLDQGQGRTSVIQAGNTPQERQSTRRAPCCSLFGFLKCILRSSRSQKFYHHVEKS